MNITEKVRAELVMKAVEEGNVARFWMMTALPAACDQMKKIGIELAGEQELRSLLTKKAERYFILFWLDGAKGEDYWAIWEVGPKVITYDNVAAVITEKTWRGYILGQRVKEVMSNG